MPVEVKVTQAVPFFTVTEIEVSARFYVEGLGFTITNEWRPAHAAGRLQWCWLERGGAAVMLQEYGPDGQADGPPPTGLGRGACVYFICTDAVAIYEELRARGVAAGRPFVGNRMWVTSVTDPDGYQLYFESPTDAPEETILAE